MDPFELHPKDRETLKNHIKPIFISIEKLKSTVRKKLSKIKKEQPPLWGYSKKDIESLLVGLVEEAALTMENEDDR
jgi:hypothetical protein